MFVVYIKSNIYLLFTVVDIMSDLFKRLRGILPATTPKIRATSWVIAGAGFYAWYEYDKRKGNSLAITEDELRKINEGVKRRETSPARKKKDASQ